MQKSGQKKLHVSRLDRQKNEAYETPKLVRYGKVKDLTQSSGDPVTSDMLMTGSAE